MLLNIKIKLKVKIVNKQILAIDIIIILTHFSLFIVKIIKQNQNHILKKNAADFFLSQLFFYARFELMSDFFSNAEDI